MTFKARHKLGINKDKINMRYLSRSIGVMAIVSLAVGTQAALINVDDDLTINGVIAPGKATTGYVNNGQGGISYEHVYSGAFAVTAVNHSQSGSSLSFLTFCTDVGVNWQYGDQDYTAMNFSSAGSGIAPPWSVVPEAIQNAAYIYNQIFLPLGSGVTADQSSGVQLAIWKVLYDTVAGGSLVNSSFSAGNLLAYGFGTTALADAATYVSQVITARGNPSTFPLYNDTWLSPDKGNSQGLLWNGSTPSYSVIPVPEASTIVAGLLLILPLGASTARILRQNRKGLANI